MADSAIDVADGHVAVRLDWDRWVVDCPSPICTNAMLMQIGQREFLCRFPVDDRGNFDGCGTSAIVDWPDNPEGIQHGMAGLPEAKREWRPPPPDVEDPEQGTGEDR